jgi:CMP-2-keto-3-deoxyoctulosonic acid synthetase
MKAAPSNLDDSSLASLGADAARLIGSGNIDAVCARFGYALAFTREPVAAIKDDLAHVLTEIGASGFSDEMLSNITVRHFTPNEARHTSLVECLLTANNGRQVLVELVLLQRGSDTWVTLEQISAVR